MPRPHDMGGQPAGPMDLAEHPRGDFERHTDALIILLGATGRCVFRVDELRRAIESLPDYDSLAYYEKWAKALKLLLVEKGVISEQELAEKLAELRR
ncbi:MAG: nitrile hydratase subunit beta [Proteobacteria bacterium]|nr:nitrile hydratase subunit beta [Pseudomonadota bacterium]